MKGFWYLLIGGVLGLLMGWALGFLRLPALEMHHSFWVGFTGCFALMIMIILVLQLIKKHRQMQRSRDVASSSEQPGNVRRSFTLMWLLVLGFLLAAGMSTSIIFYRQGQEFKALTKEQSRHIEEQDEIIHSIRTNNLIVLMSSVLDQARDEIQQDTNRRLSEATLDRIAGLSYSFKPYRQLVGDSLSSQALSPERAQLLLALTAMPMSPASFDQIKQRTSFEGADLAEAELSGLDLSGVNLAGANLKNARLKGSRLNGADLSRANLWGADLSEVHMKNAQLKRANLSWTEMNGAQLQGSLLSGAEMEGAKLENSKWMGAIVEWANLRGVSLKGADLNEANLKGCNFQKANLTEAVLDSATMNWVDLSEANLVKADMSRVKLIKAGIKSDNWLEKLSEWQVKGAREIKEQYKIVEGIQGRTAYSLIKK